MVRAILIGLVVGICMFAAFDPWTWLWEKIGVKIPLTDYSERVRNENPDSVSLFLETSIVAPVIEESLCRFLPIAIAMIFQNNTLTWSIAILSSAIFGYLHGSWKHILNLGVIGFILSCLYINYGFASCLSAHMINNFLCNCFWVFTKRTSFFNPQQL